MPARVVDNPKATARGTVALQTEVTPQIRDEIVRIAKRRRETITETVSKALSQYVAADRRRK